MHQRIRTASLSVLSTALLAACPAAAEEPSAERYLEAVKVFADNVLGHGRDVYGPKRTPLFVDGINVDTHQPPVWKAEGRQWVMSNLASQQNLFRTLVGLSRATGDPKYRQAAMDAVRYAFDHLQDRGGLLWWGGHACYDAEGEQFVGEGKEHELKHHFPYYELMWQVDAAATRRLIEGIWNAHVLRWDILFVNRHGPYGRDPGPPWDREHTGGDPPLEGPGLSFMMSGADFFCAAAHLSRLSGDEKPLVWSKRLAKRYVDARHPETGLGASNFNVTSGRRMQKQFPQFAGRFSEATVTDIYGARYTYVAVCQLRLAEALGRKGEEFRRWAVEDLSAQATHCYDAKTNSFRATLIDGTRLSPADRKRDGYVGVRWLQKRKAESAHFLAYALAYKLSREPLMWRMTRSIGRGIGLGQLGEAPGDPGSIDPETPSNDPLVIFALLELHAATGQRAYLDVARRVADNALAARFHKGFFVQSKQHLFALFDDPTPLALLHVRAALVKSSEKPPAYWRGLGYFHRAYDGKGRTYDTRVIYTRLRRPSTTQE